MSTNDPFAEVFEVALYKSLDHGFTHIGQFYGERDNSIHLDAVRISEPVRLQLSPLADKEAITNAIQVLDAKERKVMADAEVALQRIREQKQSLLALTHETTETT